MEELKNEVIEVEQETEQSYKSGSVQFMDSREVAEIVGKNHTDLIRDIKRYRKQIDELNQEDTKSNIAFSDFFIESSYSVEGQSRKYPCYLVTKKGCEFIAHKLTGIKGTKFTATYINRFHEMENVIKGSELGQVQELTKQVEAMQLLMKNQQEILQGICERQNLLEVGKTDNKKPVNPYGNSRNLQIEECKKELYRLTSKVAGLCKMSQTKILHYMYRTLEEDLGIVLDAYKSVYISETGKTDTCMVEVIAANDQLYASAVEMNQSVIERKQIYG